MKSALQNFAVLSAAVALFLVGAEVFLRLFPQFLSEEARLRLHWREISQQTSEQGMTVPHPRFGFLYRAHFSGRISQRDVDFTFNTDKHGFRNPTPWPEQADIVLIGDSMAFGFGVDDEQTWSRLVENELPDLEIVNLGLPGTAPQQSVQLLEAFGFDLEPKLVLFMLFPGNDFTDAAAFEAWSEADTERSYEEWRMLGDGSRDLVAALLRLQMMESRFIAFLLGVRKTLTSPVGGQTLELEDGSRVRLAPAVLTHHVAKARPGDPAFELVVDTIERARAASREHGSRLLVLLMPTKEEVYLPRTGEPAPPLVENLAGALKKRGIDFLDLTPHFRARAEDAPPLFYEVDGHPNADGYRLIARLVANHLRESEPTYRLTAPRRRTR